MNDLAAAGSAQLPFHDFRDAQDLYAALADHIVARLAAGVARNGRAGFVASGGTTPGALYDVLATREAPWRNVAVAPSDERWIDPSSERSNENLIRTRLLTARAAEAHLVPMKTAHDGPRAAEGIVNDAIAAMPRPFDVVLLGMGTDGHTASLIPGAEGLAHALDRADPALVCAVRPPNLPAMGERMTLTLRAILDAQWIALLIRGDAKLAAYKQALAGTDVLEAPIRAVLHQAAVPLSVFWSA
ncbi:MAG: 6-phosphogluconolactonase [Rhizomicrobium sp.]